MGQPVPTRGPVSVRCGLELSDKGCPVYQYRSIPARDYINDGLEFLEQAKKTVNLRSIPAPIPKFALAVPRQSVLMAFIGMFPREKDPVKSEALVSSAPVSRSVADGQQKRRTWRNLT
ncbi:hypothetical protein BaRGS_00029499 [Batillaria attramentaria]|uniref:Uncharacterized protein n=1 Tax=Batillaria attramentaria TaxID=370345 RepID=A0ABD0JXB9_9CAEN